MLRFGTMKACVLLALMVNSGVHATGVDFAKKIRRARLEKSGLPDPVCATGIISLPVTSLGKKQACCPSYCGECTDYMTCRSARGQDSKHACCASEVLKMECGQGAPANTCLKKCSEALPPCIMEDGQVWNLKPPKVNAADDCNEAVVDWRTQQKAAIKAGKESSEAFEAKITLKGMDDAVETHKKIVEKAEKTGESVKKTHAAAEDAISKAEDLDAKLDKEMAKNSQSTQLILHHVDDCKQCGIEWCDNYAIDSTDAEAGFTTGDSLSSWGCSHVTTGTERVRNSKSGSIYVVETAEATLHYVGECNQCGLEWCSDYKLNVANVESFFSRVGDSLSSLGCSYVSKETVKVRDAKTEKIFAVVPKASFKIGQMKENLKKSKEKAEESKKDLASAETDMHASKKDLDDKLKKLEGHSDAAKSDPKHVLDKKSDLHEAHEAAAKASEHHAKVEHHEGIVKEIVHAVVNVCKDIANFFHW